MPTWMRWGSPAQCQELAICAEKLVSISEPPSGARVQAAVANATAASDTRRRRTVIVSTISWAAAFAGETALERQQEPAPLVVPAVAPQGRSGANDALAGHEELDRASGQRAPGGAAAAGGARGGRDVAVGPELSVRDRADELQDAPAEPVPDRGQVDGRLEGPQPPGEVGLDL